MEKQLYDSLSQAGFEIIKQAQDIIRLNGAYKSGRLLNSFDIRVSETPSGFSIAIKNSAPYAEYINRGTYQWKNRDQQASPVIRKYAAIPPTGYPKVLGGYPFNRKGIEPIYFMEPVRFNLPRLTDIIRDGATEYFLKEIVDQFKEELKINK